MVVQSTVITKSLLRMFDPAYLARGLLDIVHEESHKDHSHIGGLKNRFSKSSKDGGRIVVGLGQRKTTNVLTAKRVSIIIIGKSVKMNGFEREASFGPEEWEKPKLEVRNIFCPELVDAHVN